MLLTSVQEIREELGFDDMPDINNAITMALNASESLLGSTLGTTFERKSLSDTFWVSSPSFRQASWNKTEFLLSAGFLVGSPTVTSANLGDISSAFKFDIEKGIGRDWVTRYDGDTVTIEYVCGFETEVFGDPPAPTGSYVLSQVPDWLKQAAKVKTLLLLAKFPAITEAGIELDTKVLDQQYAALVNSHIRYAPAALLSE